MFKDSPFKAPANEVNLALFRRIWKFPYSIIIPDRQIAIVRFSGVRVGSDSAAHLQVI